jgi:class 3 adenylate cyclase
VLAEHRWVVRDAIDVWNGVEVDTQGDAFFVAFSRAADAVASAAAIHQRLADGPVAIRIGLHSGEPTVTYEGYVGIDVHHGAAVRDLGEPARAVTLAAAVERVLSFDAAVDLALS